MLLSPHAAAALVSCQSVALLARHLTSAAADRVSPAKSAAAAAGGEREVIGVPLLFKEVNTHLLCFVPPAIIWLVRHR